MSDGGAQHNHLFLGTDFAGFTLDFYEAGTSTGKNVWNDETKSSPLQQVQADSRGMAEWYADGDYRVVITDASGTVLWDWPSTKMTADTGTMWEGNFGTAFPSARTSNRWQQFVKVTAGNDIVEIGINNGTSFIPITNVVNVLHYGATNNGLETGTAVRTAAATLTDNSVLYFPSGTYLMEGAVSDPYLSSNNAIAVLLQNLTNVWIILDGATIKQTSATVSTVGVFTFDTCVDSGLVGGRLDGYYLAGNRSAALVAGIGACDGITVHSNAEGGRGLAVFRSSDGTTSGTKPINTSVKGITRDGEYGVSWTHCGYGHSVDLVCDTPLRSVYITGTSGIVGKIRSANAGATDINISTRGGGAIDGVDLVYEADTPNQAIRLYVEDSTAATIKNINIRGSVKDCLNDTVAMTTLGHANTVFQDIDLGGLSIDNSTGNGVEITPDVAGTIQGVTLPKYISSQLEPVKIDNTIGATISNVNRHGGRWFHSVSPAVTSDTLKISGGTVSNVNIRDIDMTGSTTSASTDVMVTTVDGLVIDGCIADNEIYVIGSTNVKPNCNNDHNGQGYVLSGSLANSKAVSWLDTIILSSGSTAITALTRGVLGQKITVCSTGGTNTFTDGSTLELNGDLTFTDTDTLTLICTTGGEASVFTELSRSVN